MSQIVCNSIKFADLLSGNCFSRATVQVIQVVMEMVDEMVMEIVTGWSLVEEVAAMVVKRMC